MFNSIDKMVNEIVSIMDGGIYGIWLYGSVAMDDFRPGWSDIDFVALTDNPIKEEQAERLLLLRQDCLRNEPDNRYYRSFEGVIANRDEFLKQDFSRVIYWGTSGEKILDRYNPDPFARFELAKYEKAVCGNRKWPLPEPGRAELVDAIRAHYDTIRKYAAVTNSTLYSCGWLLDIARCIYTLRNNDVIAKTQAGTWALNNHIFREEEPLRRAIEIRQNPLKYKDQPDVKNWLSNLGPTVQSYADVLGKELAILYALEFYDEKE